MRFFITDIKRGLVERTFLASLALGSACLLVSVVMLLQGNADLKGFTLFKQAQSLILPFVAPLLAALPYANMSMLEADCGYQRLMMSKRTMKPYRVTRWLVSSLLSGLAIALPLAMLAVLCYISAPHQAMNQVAGIIFLDFLFGFAYGTLSYGLTFINQKRYIPTVAPQVIYLLFIYAFPYLGLDKYYPPLSFSPWLISNVAYEFILLQLSLITLIGVGLMVGAMTYQVIKRLCKMD